MDLPKSDLARSTQHEPDFSWPSEVRVTVIWNIHGRAHVRSEFIDANTFFGHGGHGAPMEGSALIGMIDRLRRAGPPPVPRSNPKPYHGGSAKKRTSNGKAR